MVIHDSPTPSASPQPAPSSQQSPLYLCAPPLCHSRCRRVLAIFYFLQTRYARLRAALGACQYACGTCCAMCACEGTHAGQCSGTDAGECVRPRVQACVLRLHACCCAGGCGRFLQLISSAHACACVCVCVCVCHFRKAPSHMTFYNMMA